MKTKKRVKGIKIRGKYITGDTRNYDKDDRQFAEMSHVLPLAPKYSKQYVIIDSDERVTRKENITIRYHYPLGADVDLPFKKKGGWTRGELFNVIQEGYVKIYEEEDAGVKNYGIWGHDLGDLVLEEVKITDEGQVRLSVGS